MEPKSFQTQTDEAPCAVRVFICTIMGAEKNLNEQKHAFNNRKKSVQNVANRTRIEGANKKKNWIVVAELAGTGWGRLAHGAHADTDLS